MKARGLITSPARIVVKAADEFKDKTNAPNEMWQTDFTCPKIIGRGWYYLSTILDDYSRFIIAWRLLPTMCADDGAFAITHHNGASDLNDPDNNATMQDVRMPNFKLDFPHLYSRHGQTAAPEPSLAAGRDQAMGAPPMSAGGNKRRAAPQSVRSTASAKSRSADGANAAIDALAL